jgi:hypothetical protein
VGCTSSGRSRVDDTIAGPEQSTALAASTEVPLGSLSA